MDDRMDVLRALAERQARSQGQPALAREVAGDCKHCTTPVVQESLTSAEADGLVVCSMRGQLRAWGLTDAGHAALQAVA